MFSPSLRACEAIRKKQQKLYQISKAKNSFCKNNSLFIIHNEKDFLHLQSIRGEREKKEIKAMISFDNNDKNIHKNIAKYLAVSNIILNTHTY